VALFDAGEAHGLALVLDGEPFVARPSQWRMVARRRPILPIRVSAWHNANIATLCGGFTVPQLHCYVPKGLAERLQEKADQAHLSLSKYLALLIERDVEASWPPDYFDVFGSWKGEHLERDHQGDFENRERLD